MAEAGTAWPASTSRHLSLFSMPNVEDVEGHLMAQDVVWVNGGSVANLLAVWRVHGLDAILRRVWQAGVVLAGVSAGSICWYQGGTTDSFGPELRAVTNGLGFLPYANGVHYDSEAGRRPLVHRAGGRRARCPTTHCTDDGVGIVYRGTEMVEAVSEVDGKGAYVVTPRRRQGRRGAAGRAAPGLSLSDRACAGPHRSSTGAGPSPGVTTRAAVPLSALARAASMTARVCTASRGSTGMAACASSACSAAATCAVEVDLAGLAAPGRRALRPVVDPAAVAVVACAGRGRCPGPARRR